MKKSKKQIEEILSTRIHFKIKELLLNEDYHKLADEYKELEKKYTQAADEDRGHIAIELLNKIKECQRKHSFSFLDIEFLKKVEKTGLRSDWKDKKLLNLLDHLGFGYLVENKKDDFGYLNIKIKPNIPRHLIHYSIDNLLDKYELHNTSKANEKKERFRDERIISLTVWEQRRLKKPFKKIAKALDIKIPTARKSYYKAYELLYGKKYNPADFKKTAIKKEYLKRECSTCDEKSTCKDLCPDVISFVEQDTKSYLRESLSN